jgi:hypothetical protein
MRRPSLRASPGVQLPTSSAHQGQHYVQDTEQHGQGTCKTMGYQAQHLDAAGQVDGGQHQDGGLLRGDVHLPPLPGHVHHTAHHHVAQLRHVAARQRPHRHQLVHALRGHTGALSTRCTQPCRRRDPTSLFRFFICEVQAELCSFWRSLAPSAQPHLDHATQGGHELAVNHLCAVPPA